MKNSLKLLATALACATLSLANAGTFFQEAQPHWMFGIVTPWILDASHAYAQVVTAEHKGAILGAFLPIECGTGDVIVEIRDASRGMPGSTVLDQATIDPATFNVTGMNYAPLEGRAVVTPTQEVAIVMQNRTGTCWIYPSYNGSYYSGGEGWVATGGGSWAPLPPTLPPTAPYIPFVLVQRY